MLIQKKRLAFIYKYGTTACLSFARLVYSGALALALGLFAGPDQAIDLKPKAFPLAILGVRVTIPVTISFDAKTEGDRLALRVRAEGNLKDVQDKALDIARALPVPEGN
jgi:hypothetical protein